MRRFFSTPAGPTTSKSRRIGGTSGSSQHLPTPEQAHCVDLFRKGGSLRINAYAGTGKTSTLEMLAHSTRQRGQYLAFNRDIVREARHRFPETLNCSTVHGLAYRALAPRYQGGADKLTGRINANELADALRLKRRRIDEEHVLTPRSQASLILDTLRRFCISADLEPREMHVPRHGVLAGASRAALQAAGEIAVQGAKHAWERMADPDDPIQLGHDGYLKLWALREPQIAADYILIDEAQDTNPVVLDVLSRQSAQMVYVGDRYQQIYEWRGAMNAMDAIDTDQSTYLTTSFRFGAAIAEGATGLLRLMGESRPVQGNPVVKSRIGQTRPAAILARTNAAAITAVIEALDEGQRPHLFGGTGELSGMLRGVAALKEGKASTIPDFFGFADWEQVVKFARSGEGEHLQTFVKLVETRGERQLLWALRRSAEEGDANVVVSTAHKAKGREWSTVRLMDDFVKNLARQGGGVRAGQCPYDAGELRLLYVALTRARKVVEVPPPLLALMNQSDAKASLDLPSHTAGYAGRQDRKGTSQSLNGRQLPSPSTPLPKRPQGRQALPSQSKVTPNRPQPVRPKKTGILGWLLG